MRLLKARFENFRLLRELEINFAHDPIRKLTVIRAANESGKTTLLHALQWGLYGDDALPGRANEFRLHPIDWSADGSPRIPITVTIEFEVVKYNNIRGVMRESKSTYRIVRTAFEELRGADWSRSPSMVRLYALNESGATIIDTPEALIHEELPLELREVFFTDGDRALSFIESNVAVSTKRDRVQRAIRALLGLGVVEESLRHVKKAASDVNRQAKSIGGNEELNKVVSRLVEGAEQLANLEGKINSAKEQFAAYDVKLSEVEKQIDEALKKGDREKLSTDVAATKRSIDKIDERLAGAIRNHSQLFRSKALAEDILAPVLQEAQSLLDTMHDRGQIPSTTIPVLEHRLENGTCICGETLAEDDPDGAKRRGHIVKMIESSRKADELQGLVTELYFGAKSVIGTGSTSAWLPLYVQIVEDRDGLNTLRDEEGRKLKALEAQIDALPNTDIQGLRQVQRDYKEQRDRFNADRSRFETQFESLTRELHELEAKRDTLLRHQKKGARILSELDAVSDIQAVLERAYQRITSEELAKVSALMNSLFMEMIGADPEQGAIIKRAEINADFDILVYGPNDRILNPDRDLNGASRRALTIAFILALTKVSEVEAPNVIDTPLGMMSGYVKRSVLRIAARESSQLVLFLTHSEIAGCEDILDQIAGKEYTLSNAAHYPRMLRNNPMVQSQRVLLCDCGHRQSCSICERVADELVGEAA